MEITEIVAKLKDQFGDKIDMTKVTSMLKGIDHSKMSFTEIVDKLKHGGLIGDLDGDGKVESTFEEIKGKATGIFGGIFGKQRRTE